MDLHSLDDYSRYFLKISTKKAELSPLIFNKEQLELSRIIREKKKNREPVRLIVLKARQLGISTFGTAFVYHQCVTNEMQKGVVIANDVESTKNLFKMCKQYWGFSPEPIRPMKRNDNARALVFENPDPKTRKASPGLLSSMHLESANKLTAGRSGTIHHLHISEFAFWTNAATVVTGLFQAVPLIDGTSIIIESTANGMAGIGQEFYERWRAAEMKESDFTPIFFPWNNNPEYSKTPPPDFELSYEEKEIAKRHNLSNDQMCWRRYKIKNEMGSALMSPETQFMQEYPLTPEQSFIASGRTVFESEKIQKMISRLTTKNYEEVIL